MTDKETFRELNAKVFGRIVADYVVGAGWDELGWPRFVARVVAIGAGIGIACFVSGPVTTDLVLGGLLLAIVILGALDVGFACLGSDKEEEGRD